jgi:outer membrane protein TolC
MNSIHYLLAFFAVLGLSGCVSSSIGSDVARVRELGRVDAVARVADADVEPTAARDARRILERPLDADAAVRVALLNNRELRATLREMGIARGRLIQAGLLPNPVVEAELLPERDTELELRLEYDISGAILAPLRARAAEPDLEAARYRGARAVVDLGYRVRAAFYRLLAAEQRVRVARQVLDAFAATREAARALADAGNIAELELASREAAYERAQVTVAELELEAVAAREQLHRLLGAPESEQGWRVRGELAAPPERPSIPTGLETRALRASLDLEEARHRLEGLARRAGFTRTAGLLPDIVVDVHALHGSPEDAEVVPAERDFRFGAGVSMSIPLFDRRQGTVVSLEAEYDALMERYYGMAVDIRSAAREARSRVTSAHTRARQYQNVIVPAQRRVVEQTLLQYNAMQLGIFELLEARREQLGSELAYVETLREYWTSTAELDALLVGRRVSPASAGTGVVMDAPSEPRGGH